MKNGQTTLFQTWGYFEKQKDQKQDIDDQELCDAFKDDIDIDENLLGENSFLDDKFQKLTSPETITGFDISTGSNYVYPTNYPIREYQFRIIKKALLKNTLVVLPTGLGKTFIAAVVMYNYYRWYPSGKIIFMAPTKPLVAQQIEACYKIMGIPQEDTAEMTGTMQPTKRLTLWQNKRVFFLTPQILQNDLAKGTCSGTDVVCLVFDEAHKAQGNHAYCQVVKDIKKVNPQFRILALSATPGGDMKAVQKVVENLLISHVEIRSDESADIKRYIRDRLVEKIVVPITEELKNIKNTFMEILRNIVNRLYHKKALWQNDPEKISKFLLLKAREQWRLNNALGDKNKMGLIEGDFALCMSLYHAYELLQQHGILSFYNFLKGILSGVKGTSRSKVELSKNTHFMKMMEELSVKIEPDVANLSFNESFLGIKLTTKQRLLKTIPKPKDGFYSHPKLKKLEEIVIDHFTRAQRENEANNIKSQTCLNTRVMIFSQYRDSVQEITALLNKHEPLVRVMSFIGQGSKEGMKGKNTKGLSQKEQIEILERFRQGGFNTVVSTSVGEEGLDIGDVDLIVCYDASNSPIRLVQRMGRTGRKRNGRIVILVGEGKEEATYKRSQSNKKGIHSQLLSAAKTLQLYTEDCRMIPKHINPTCIKTFIDVCAYRKDEKKTKKGCTSTKTTKSKADKKGVSCEECERLQTEKCEVHATKTRKRAEKKTENFKKPETIKKAGKNKENKLNAGEIWRKHYAESLRHDVVANKGNSDDEFDSFFDNQLKTDIQQKLKNDIFGSKNDVPDEQLKPCPLEALLEKVESDIKKNKKKVRVTKLPKRLSKEAEHIEDNQLGFCSQVSMDTLYNRCQERRKSQLESLLQIAEEDCETNDEEDIEENGTGKINDGDDLNAVQGLSRLLPITSPVQTEKIESAKVFGVNAANEVDDSDELKASQGLSRFLPMNSPVQTGKLESTKKVCVVSPFVPESVPEAPIDIDLSSFLLDPTEEDLRVKSPKLKENRVNNVVPLAESKYTCVKEKDNIISINDDLLFSDDDEDEDDEEMSSPPVVSQLMQSKRVTNNTRKINLDNIFSNCSETESVENNESPIKRKKVLKKTLRIEDDSIPLVDINTSEPFNHEEEESPLFRKPKQNRRRVWESQTTPIHAAVNDKKKNGSGGTKRKWSNNLDVKTTKLKGNLHARMYIDDEAEDDCDESHHENEVTIGGYLLDSFIDDASQVTPAPRKKRRTKRDSADTPDMDVIYKQSLMSPKFSLLNFRTPAFKVNRNRYKMVEKCNYASDESSEAEEVNGLVESEEDLPAKEEDTCYHDDSTKPEKPSNNRPTIMKNVGQNRCGRVRPFEDSDDEDFLQPNVSLNKRRHSPAADDGAMKSDDSLKVTFDCRPRCKTFSADDITVVTFSFDIPWVESPEKRRANTSCTVDSPPHVVIVDSEHAKDSQIPSLLRTNHQCHVIRHSQVGCHYAVSLRCGIVKTKLSDISNKVALTRLKEVLSTLTQLYKKPCLIIEKDCDEKMVPSKNYFIKKFSHLNVIHSVDEVNTTKLIFKLLNEELSAGCAISHLRKPHPDQMIASLLQMSSMTYPIALEISNQFRDIYDLRKRSYDALKGKLPNVSSQIVADLFCYIREKC